MKFIHHIDPDKFVINELDICTDKYVKSLNGQGFYIILWFNYKGETTHNLIPSSNIYLIPPYRSVPVSVADKTGHIIAFKRDYMDEDEKEYSLDILHLFRIEGERSVIELQPEAIQNISYLTSMMMQEFSNPFGTYLILKSLLKVLLLNLIRIDQRAFLNQDINQKRVYQLLMLVDENYQQERNASFYANKIDIGEKRLNQILKEKIGKTLTQLLHLRLITEIEKH